MPARITRDDLRDRLACSARPLLVEASGAAFYDDARLPGAVNIPPGQVDRLASALIPTTDFPVVVYCSGSSTSAEAVAARLEQLGYTAVAVYEGGKEDWVEHGLPLERADVNDRSDQGVPCPKSPSRSPSSSTRGSRRST